LLQRFQALHASLSRVTAESALVATDDRRLMSAERHGYVRAARHDARRLRRDAATLMTRSGAAGNHVRTLARQASPGVVKRYLVAIRDSLTADWYEGSALMRVARTIAGDPFGLVPATGGHLHTYQSRAMRDARRAARFAGQASALRRRYPAHFRYVSITAT
jgi:hypothetical protein